MTLPQQHALRLVVAASTAAAAALASSTSSISSTFEPSRNPFTSVLPLESTPQFIVLTFDDSISPLAVDLYSQLSTVRHKDGCPLTATWYASVAEGNTGEELSKCELVKALYRGGHEMATHTYSHAGDPSADEISGARRWLSEECGVPVEEIRGFRAPYLQYSQDTFVRLQQLGFTYDSSVTEGSGTDSDGGRDHVWPYTMDGCGASVWACDDTKAVPGLYEVPMWTVYEPGTESDPLVPMDYPGDAAAILNQNFYRRYDVNEGGNRAPMGIFLHAAWLRTHGATLRDWAEDILANHDDVHFVTNYQLLQWMSDPVPASEYNRAEFCADLQPECLPPLLAEGGCGFGTFDTDLCECSCVSPYSGRNCMDVNHHGGGVGAATGGGADEYACERLPRYSVRSYYSGEKVLHGSNVVYKCKAWPNTGLCEQGDTYEPGNGRAWEDAWDEIGTCPATADDGNGSSTSTSSTSSSSPNTDTNTNNDGGSTSTSSSTSNPTTDTSAKSKSKSKGDTSKEKEGTPAQNSAEGNDTREEGTTTDKNTPTTATNLDESGLRAGNGGAEQFDDASSAASSLRMIITPTLVSILSTATALLAV